MIEWNDERANVRRLLGVLALWGLTVTLCAAGGVYRAMPTLLVAPIIALGIAVPVAIYALSTRLRATLAAIGLRALTAFHIWRIGAALVFLWYGAHVLIPESFARNAGWGDLIAGLLAWVVTGLPERRSRYLVFHLVGFADFVVAVGTGLTFFLRGDPRMSAIQSLPLALIPLWGVGISGAGHLVAFDLLRRGAPLVAKEHA